MTDLHSQYIRYFWFDGNDYIIICFFEEQLEEIRLHRTLEVDMSFQRIGRAGEGELTLGRWSEQQRKGLIYILHNNRLLTGSSTYLQSCVYKFGD